MIGLQAHQVGGDLAKKIGTDLPSAPASTWRTATETGRDRQDAAELIDFGTAVARLVASIANISPTLQHHRRQNRSAFGTGGYPNRMRAKSDLR